MSSNTQWLMNQRTAFGIALVVSAAVGALTTAALLPRLIPSKDDGTKRNATSSAPSQAESSTSTWRPVSIPYHREENGLTLPSIDEIRHSTEVLEDMRSCKVVKFGNLVVKYGPRVQLFEGQALLYLEHSVPSLNVPRLLAMYQDGSDRFLVMTYMPGERLDRVWPQLSDMEKTSITTSLREMFDAIRVAPCPWNNYFGCPDGQGLPNYLFNSFGPGGGRLGPFKNGREVADALSWNYRTLQENNRRHNFKIQFYERHLGDMLAGHRPVFTHADVQKKNILVTKTTSADASRLFDVSLIDWEEAGWYPEFFEYFLTSTTNDMTYWEDDWVGRIEDFLKPWPKEYVIMRMIEKDLYF